MPQSYGEGLIFFLDNAVFIRGNQGAIFPFARLLLARCKGDRAFPLPLALYKIAFIESFDSMKAGSEGFEATGGKVMAAFGETATCRQADVYNSKVFFDPTNPDFS